MAIEPVTREERFLAAAGGRSVTPPAPITRKEQLLQGIIDAVKSGGATPDVIEGAVNDYLNANPVQPGATTEQVAQIEQNKTDIADLQAEVDELKESGGNGSGQNVDLTGYAKETWVQAGFQPKGDYLTKIPTATPVVLGGVKPSIEMGETMTQPVAVGPDGRMWTTAAASGTVLVAASDAPAVIKAAAQYVCTGVNDQLTINAAIDAVGEGEVRLSGGSYYLTGSIYPKSKTIVVGRNATLYMSDEISSTVTQAYTAGDTVVHVEDAGVFVLGQKVCTDAGIKPAYKCRIVAIDAENNTVTLDNPLATDGNGFDAGDYRLIVDFSAVWFDGVSDATVEGVIVEGNKTALTFHDTDYGNNGILFSDATRCKAVECTSNNVLTHGFLILNSAQCQEINCVAKGCTRLSYDVFGGVGGHLIHGCVAINGSTGFQQHAAVNTIVSNCIATGCSIGFSAQTGVKNVLFIGCSAYTTGYGFKCIVGGSKVISIVGCTIVDSTQDGIQLDATNATELCVANNVIKNTTQRAVWLLGANGFTITGNHITDCCTMDTGAAVSDKAAICIYGAAKNGLVTGNNIQLNTTESKGCACGIAEYSMTGDSNVVVNNVIRGARIAATNKMGANSKFENNYEFA